jgi:hypothetical protein
MLIKKSFQGLVNSKKALAHAQFFPLKLARSKRGEGPSRTPNEGVALLWLTGGLLFAGLSPTPRHSIAEAEPSLLGKEFAPRFSVCEGPSPRFGSSPPPWLGPGSQDDSRRQARYYLESRMSFSSAGGGGVYLPASSKEKSAPHGAKRSVLAPGPWQSSMKKTGGASKKARCSWLKKIGGCLNVSEMVRSGQSQRENFGGTANFE